MWLLVGLGNPGAEHAYQRHNIGFMALDDVVERHGLGPFRKRFQGLACDGRIGDQRVVALKPQTYMNQSGRSVGEAMRFYKLASDRVIVFYDELDLAPGRCRVKRAGGAGGHNGIRDIDRHIGPDYWRVRLGIGHPGDKNRVHGYVLHNFSNADEQWLDPLLEAVARSTPSLLDGRADAFMNAVSLAVFPSQKDRQEETGNGPRKGEKAEQLDERS